MSSIFIFDIDDTLYDQLAIFENTFNKNFTFKGINLEEVYKSSRKISDDIFNDTENGGMSLEEMHIKRIQKPLQDININISKEQAIKFQADYLYLQDTITLDEEIERLLDFLIDKKVKIGIISNGPGRHQRKKVDNLGLNKWINDENIFLSGDVGIHKPDEQIFKMAEKSLRKSDEDIIYFVGDNFEKDIVTPNNLGWNTIWINKRQYKKENLKSNANSYMVKNSQELEELVYKLLAN